MCGIVAYVGAKTPNELALKILGNENTTRGKNAFGICVNDVIEKKVCKVIHPSVNSENTFKSYFENKLLFRRTNKNNIIKMKNRTVLIHTRSKSSGINTEENAHPFKLETEKEGVFLIGVHNGTITNCDELAAEYGIEDWEKTYRVDSNFMLSFLAKGDFSILEKYKGNANFVWFTTDKPNTLNIWKGGTINRQGVLEEERPLYYSFENSTGGYYISSLDDPLHGVSSGEVVSFKTNTITSFEGNQIIEEIKVDRKIKLEPYVHKNNFSNNPSYSKSVSNNTNGGGNKTVYVKKPEGLDEPINLDEVINNPDLVYFYQGRYKKEGVNCHFKANLTNEGLVVSSTKKDDNATLRHFWNGFSVTEEMWGKLNTEIGEKRFSPYVLSSENMVNHLIRSTNGWWISGGIKATALNLKPKYSFFTYTFENGEATKITPIFEKLKPFVTDECVINFNIAFAHLGVFYTWEQCKEAYASEFPNSPNVSKAGFSNASMKS